jgi:hypothetical protein
VVYWSHSSVRFMGLAEVSFTGFVHWFGSLVSLHFVHWVALIGFIGSSDVFFMGNNLKVLRSFSMLSCVRYHRQASSTRGSRFM